METPPGTMGFIPKDLFKGLDALIIIWGVGTHRSEVKSSRFKGGGILQKPTLLLVVCRSITENIHCVVWSSLGGPIDHKNFTDTSNVMPRPLHLNTPQAPQTQEWTRCFSPHQTPRHLLYPQLCEWLSHPCWKPRSPHKHPSAPPPATSVLSSFGSLEMSTLSVIGFWG